VGNSARASLVRHLSGRKRRESSASKVCMGGDSLQPRNFSNISLCKSCVLVILCDMFIDGVGRNGGNPVFLVGSAQITWWNAGGGKMEHWKKKDVYSWLRLHRVSCVKF